MVCQDSPVISKTNCVEIFYISFTIHSCLVSLASLNGENGKISIQAKLKTCN